MMSKTSFNKSNTGFNLFGFTVKRNLGLILLFCFAELLICPGYLIVALNRGINNLSVYLKAFSVIGTVLGSITVIIFIYLSFSYLYSKRSGDVFHALPLKRSSLLLSRFFGAVCSVLIPITLGFISFSIVSLFYHNDITLTTVLICYIFTVSGILILSSLFLIFVVCAAGTLDLFLSFFGINIGLVVIGLIIANLMSEHIRGYTINMEIVEFLSPLWWFYSKNVAIMFTEMSFDSTVLLFILRSLVYFAVFLAISILLYSKRKAERSESSYAYRFIYYICSVIISIVSAYAIGMIFSQGDGGLLFWLFGIPGAILASVTFGAISNRGFKKLGKSLLIGVITVALLVTSIVFISNDLFGIGNYIPNAEDIKSAKITVYNQTVTMDNPELAIELHKKAISTNNPDDTDRGYSSVEATDLKIEYTLTDNSTVEREYYLLRKDVFNQALPILTGEYRKKGLADEINKLNPGRICVSSQETDPSSGEEVTKTRLLNKQNLLDLLDIYFSELKEADTEALFCPNSRDSVYYISISASNYAQGYPEEYYNFNLPINKSFTKTPEFISGFTVASE